MRIVDPERLATAFLDEWRNDKDYVIAHTSGSTGTPKEIHLLKSDMLLSAKSTCRIFGITDRSRLVLPLSTDYIAGKMMVVRSIVSGAELIVERPSSHPLTENYGKVDLTAIVPSQIDGLLKSQSDIRQVIVGGGQIPADSEQRLIDSLIDAYATYGMTETCSHVALRKMSEERFTAINGITFTLDHRGCLTINASEFSFKKLTTNDIAMLHDSRHFTWIGRADNVINSGGVKLHPEIIERRLSAIIPYPFYITGRRSERWGEEAVLYVESTDIDKNIIIEKARSVLDRYSVPKEVICVPEFQRTYSGKIKRVLL